MIISASRRTDLPAFHGPWFMDRIGQGFVKVVNPVNPLQVSTISLLPRDVDMIVFWTKNPRSIMPCLGEIRNRGLECLFQFTLTPYGKDLEPGLEDKTILIERFKQLALILGPERVLWRYDPIIFTKIMTPQWHQEQFMLLCRELKGYTRRCTISFLDLYKKIEKDMNRIKPLIQDDQTLRNFSTELAIMAHKAGMEIVSCATELDLSQAGISHGSCIDGPLIEQLTGKKIKKAKDRGQRPFCSCVKSRDVGAYGTCLHGCYYCYAR